MMATIVVLLVLIVVLLAFQVVQNIMLREILLDMLEPQMMIDPSPEQVDPRTSSERAHAHIVQVTASRRMQS